MELPCGVLFIGSGVSSSVPILHHSLNPEKYKCFCSHVGKDEIPFDIEKNTRKNVSILVRIPNNLESGEYFNILVDMGKSFREAALSVFPKFNISKIDSILITHQHNDAIGGLSSMLYFEQDENSLVPIYLNKETLALISSRFKKTIMNHVFKSESNESPKFVHRYELNILDTEQGKIIKCLNKNDLSVLNDSIYSGNSSNEYRNIEFYINSIKITAIPMNHGHCICIGYCFHFTDKNIIYVSDFTFPMLKSSIEFFNSIKNEKSILILDSISYDKSTNAHADITQSLNFIQELSPDYVYFVGMSCSLEYKDSNKRLYNELINLRKQGKCTNTISMELAYDGLFLPI
ncbi:putative hydrolase [Cryptosporidium felis]|nr:putative hydrolase [Cryptosporidium felis]